MIRDSIRSLLTGDATLMASLTGGVHAATEISRRNTPGASGGLPHRPLDQSSDPLGTSGSRFSVTACPRTSHSAPG